MEKQVNKIICNHCMGNGYLRINTSSQGEVDPSKDIEQMKGVN
jgi:hypothetical protein